MGTTRAEWPFCRGSMGETAFLESGWMPAGDECCRRLDHECGRPDRRHSWGPHSLPTSEYSHLRTPTGTCRALWTEGVRVARAWFGGMRPPVAGTTFTGTCEPRDGRCIGHGGIAGGALRPTHGPEPVVYDFRAPEMGFTRGSMESLFFFFLFIFTLFSDPINFFLCFFFFFPLSHAGLLGLRPLFYFIFFFCFYFFFVFFFFFFFFVFFCF